MVGGDKVPFAPQSYAITVAKNYGRQIYDGTSGNKINRVAGCIVPGKYSLVSVLYIRSPVARRHADRSPITWARDYSGIDLTVRAKRARVVVAGIARTRKSQPIGVNTERSRPDRPPGRRAFVGAIEIIEDARGRKSHLCPYDALGLQYINQRSEDRSDFIFCGIQRIERSICCIAGRHRPTRVLGRGSHSAKSIRP